MENDTTEAPKAAGATAQDEKPKPKMSFADWKKSIAAPETSKPQNSVPPKHGGGGGGGNRKQQATTSRKATNTGPPPPLMSINVNQLNLGPPNNFNNNNGYGNNYNKNGHYGGNRGQQPPHFWDDLTSPLRQPPMQAPLPSWPPQKSMPYHKPRSNQPHSRAKKQQHGNESNASGTTTIAAAKNVNEVPSEEALAAALLMPPPPPPPPAAKKSKQQQPHKQSPQKTNTTTKSPIVAMTPDGQWISKPLPPPPIDEKDPGSKEERQRQWKEYRQAMKPFKNREFHNHKRCIQRLTKLPESELDEKQKEQLQKAMEFVSAHKAMLTVKHAERWVPKENPEPGEAQIYVRRPISSFWDRRPNLGNPANPFRKYVPIKQYIGTGRAIKGAGITTPEEAAAAGGGAAIPPMVTTSATIAPKNNANFGYGNDPMLLPGTAAAAPPMDYNASAYNTGGYNNTAAAAAGYGAIAKPNHYVSDADYYRSSYGNNFVHGDTLMPNTTAQYL